MSSFYLALDYSANKAHYDLNIDIIMVELGVSTARTAFTSALGTEKFEEVRVIGGFRQEFKFQHFNDCVNLFALAEATSLRAIKFMRTTCFAMKFTDSKACRSLTTRTRIVLSVSAT